MKVTEKWPVVTAENVFDVVRARGIRPWPAERKPQAASEYLQAAGSEQIAEFNQFAPSVEVVTHKNPHADPCNSTFTGFRVVQKPVACVFALMDGYLPVTAEWKHGNDLITLVPPAGVPGKQEVGLPLNEALEATALREFLEETGVPLRNVVHLGTHNGTWSTVRNSWTVFHSYFGRALRVEPGRTKFDATEHLAMVLFSLPEWVKLIFDTPFIPPDFGIEAVARDTTTLALRHLGRLEIKFDSEDAWSLW